MTTIAPATTTKPAPTPPSPAGSRYSCSGTQCIVDASGPWSTADCNRSCHGAPPQWDHLALSDCQPVGFDLGDENVYETYSQLTENNNGMSASPGSLVTMVRLDFASPGCVMRNISDIVVGIRLDALQTQASSATALNRILGTEGVPDADTPDAAVVTIAVVNASVYIGRRWVLVLPLPFAEDGIPRSWTVCIARKK